MEVRPILDINSSLFSHFDCGVEDLNLYFRRFAKKNDKLGIGRTYVLLKEAKVVGYYTVSMGQIEYQSLPQPSQKGIPKYPIPIVLIGKLAIDTKFQDQGLEKYLLMDILERSIRVSNEIAIFAIIVDAKNEKAKEFYARYGFVQLQNRPFSLILPMNTVKKLNF